MFANPCSSNDLIFSKRKTYAYRVLYNSILYFVLEFWFAVGTEGFDAHDAIESTTYNNSPRVAIQSCVSHEFWGWCLTINDMPREYSG